MAMKQWCLLLKLSYLISLVYLLKSTEAMFTSTVFNKALVGFAYKTNENADWLHCILACQQDDSCISYNFWPGELDGRCEMNICGFEEECSADSALFWVPGGVFQQLKPIQNAKSRCDHKRINLKKNETDVINASFSCSTKMSVYADGNIALINSTIPVKNIHCSQLRPLAITFAILKSTQVVAIAAETKQGTSTIIGSFSDGVVTDSNWKCTSGEVPHWALPEFDDSKWEQAEEISEISDTGETDEQITGILLSAKWIKAGDSDQKMYCRLRRRIK